MLARSSPEAAFVLTMGFDCGLFLMPHFTFASLSVNTSLYPVSTGGWLCVLEVTWTCSQIASPCPAECFVLHLLCICAILRSRVELTEPPCCRSITGLECLTRQTPEPTTPVCFLWRLKNISQALGDVGFHLNNPQLRRRMLRASQWNRLL